MQVLDEKLATFYKDAIEVSSARNDLFIENCFSNLARFCDLDAGLFGVRALNRKELALRVAHPFGLKGNFINELIQLPFSPSISECAARTPNKAVYGDLASRHWGANYLAREMFADLRLFNAVSVAIETADGLLSFFSGYRHKERAKIRPESAKKFERSVVTIIKLLEFRSGLYPVGDFIVQAARTGRARVNLEGCVIHADDLFIKLILMEWPTWNGVHLPMSLCSRWSLTPESPFMGKFIHVTREPGEGGYDVLAREISPVDFLTARELLIAQLFSSGRSYKEIARKLNSSPATVKTHLSHIYLKLNVHDKAELCVLVNSMCWNRSRLGPVDI